MSEESKEQAAVATTEASASQDAAAGGAQVSELDVLLREFEQQASPEQPKPQELKPDEIAVAKDEILRARDEIRREQFQRDMSSTIKAVRGDVPDSLYDDKLVRAWINAQAEEDPRLSLAWANRHAEPSKFKRVVDALAKDFKARYGKLPDKNATEDREAVAAAVRGSSTKAAEGKQPNFGSMTNTEFREWTQKNYGYTPVV